MALSALSWALFLILCTADIPTLFPRYVATGGLFSDDVQEYVHGPPSSQLLLASKIDLFSKELNIWMSSRRHSATSLRPLRSLDRRDLIVPWARTTMVKSFNVIGPSLWNSLLPV